MILKAIAVDDEVLALKKIERFCSRIEDIMLMEQFEYPEDAYYYLRHQRVDLLFLDIKMEEMSGLELIRRIEFRPFIVLTTAFSQYSLKAYDLDVADYLLKPIRFDRFQKAVERIRERKMHELAYLEQAETEEVPRASIFVKAGRSEIRIFLDDILYIEGMKDYLGIRTYKKTHMVLMSFGEILKILPPGLFSRVHRSFIVALSKIDMVKGFRVHIRGKEIPVSRSFRKEFDEKFHSGQRS